MSSSITRSGRPIIKPPMTRVDIAMEAIALAGIVVNIVIAIYGAMSLPDVIPTHVGPSGGIDSYGNKWMLIVFMSVINIALYALITLVNRYPHVFNYPVIITKENAPGLYRIAQRMIRWLKLVFCWLFAVMSGWFILVLPYHPEQSTYSTLIMLPFIVVSGILLCYYIMLMLKETKKPEMAFD
jgi:hypothetical protein